MNRIEIFWTPLARQSLQETVDFLTNIWNEEVVDNFFELVDQKIEIIQDHPNIGFKIKKSEIRRILAHPNISLFYIFQSPRIKILLIWDNRQNPKRLNEKLKNLG